MIKKRLRTVIYRDIICEDCKTSRSYKHGGELFSGSAMELEEIAAKEGWKVVGEMTLCPKCVKNHEEFWNEEEKEK